MGSRRSTCVSGNSDMASSSWISTSTASASAPRTLHLLYHVVVTAAESTGIVNAPREQGCERASVGECGQLSRVMRNQKGFWKSRQSRHQMSTPDVCLTVSHVCVDVVPRPFGRACCSSIPPAAVSRFGVSEAARDNGCIHYNDFDNDTYKNNNAGNGWTSDTHYNKKDHRRVRFADDGATDRASRSLGSRVDHHDNSAHNLLTTSTIDNGGSCLEYYREDTQNNYLNYDYDATDEGHHRFTVRSAHDSGDYDHGNDLHRVQNSDKKYSGYIDTWDKYSGTECYAGLNSGQRTSSITGSDDYAQFDSHHEKGFDSCDDHEYYAVDETEKDVADCNGRNKQQYFRGNDDYKHYQNGSRVLDVHDDPQYYNVPNSYYDDSSNDYYSSQYIAHNSEKYDNGHHFYDSPDGQRRLSQCDAKSEAAKKGHGADDRFLGRNYRYSYNSDDHRYYSADNVDDGAEYVHNQHYAQGIDDYSLHLDRYGFESYDDCRYSSLQETENVVDSEYYEDKHYVDKIDENPAGYEVRACKKDNYYPTCNNGHDDGDTESYSTSGGYDYFGYV